MRVRLIKAKSIAEYCTQQARGRSSFSIWITQLRYANWESPADIFSTFGAADLIGNGTNRVVFNVGGNTYRVICKYYFGMNQVHLFVKWVGTHAEYTKLCEHNDQYTVNLFR